MDYLYRQPQEKMSRGEVLISFVIREMQTRPCGGHHIPRKAEVGATGDPACQGWELLGCLVGWTVALMVACSPWNTSSREAEPAWRAGRWLSPNRGPQEVHSYTVPILWRSKPREGCVCC